ncbi:ribonuclease H-like domain-containing protein, partial [Tanacetum coccineum]
MHQPNRPSSTVLMAQSGINRRPSSPQVKSWRPCFNYAKGSCCFGNEGRFAHDNGTKSGNRSGTKLEDNNINELLVKLLKKLGFNDAMPTANINVPQTCVNTPSMHTVTTPNANPVASQTSGPIGPPQYAPSGHASSYVPAQLYGSPIVPPGFYYPLAHPYYPVQPHPAHQSPPQAQQSSQPQSFGYPVMGPVSQAQPVSTIGQPTASAESTSPTITSDQATTLPHAFTSGTLHDPAIGALNMDT